MTEKIKSRGYILTKMPKEKRELSLDFIEKIYERYEQDSEFQIAVQKVVKSLNFNYKYKDSVDGVDDLLGDVDELLVILGFTRTVADAEKYNDENKPRISRFAGGGFDVIQLKPYKNGVALVVFLEKRKKNQKHKTKEDVVGITVRPVAKEDKLGGLIGNEPLIMNGTTNDVWEGVSGGDDDKVVARKGRKSQF